MQSYRWPYDDSHDESYSNCLKLMRPRPVEKWMRHSRDASFERHSKRMVAFEKEHKP